MKKWMKISLYALLAIVAVTGWGYTLLRVKSTNALNQTLSDNATQINSLAFDKSADETKIAALGTQVASLKGENSASQVTITNLTLANGKLKDQLLCKDSGKYKFDFSSNASISESLKTYVGDKNGTVLTAKWETVWSNARTAIHRLTTKDYLFVYVVDFEDKDLGKLQSIYSVTDQCFFDLSGSK